MDRTMDTVQRDARWPTRRPARRGATATRLRAVSPLIVAGLIAGGCGVDLRGELETWLGRDNAPQVTPIPEQVADTVTADSARAPDQAPSAATQDGRSEEAHSAFGVESAGMVGEQDEAPALAQGSMGAQALPHIEQATVEDSTRRRVRRPPKRKAPPLGILAGSYARIREFDAEFSPRPWKIDRWDPGGFIDFVDGEQVFLTVNDEREVVPQRRGHRDFGCLSGFVESVRRTVDPQLSLLAVEPCHAGPHSAQCTPERTGLRVLERMAAHLEPLARTQPIRVQAIVDDKPLSVIPPLPWVGLCSLGHDARAQGGLHYEHHMVIASRVHDDEIIFFDVTAINGPHLRRIYEDRLRFYLAEWLAHSERFDYDPASATLSCFAVLPPEEAAQDGTRVADGSSASPGEHAADARRG